MAKLTKKVIKKLADAAGISYDSYLGSPLPSCYQLGAFIEASRTLDKPKKPSVVEVKMQAIKIAKKHQLIAGRAPKIPSEFRVVDAICEALTKK